MASFRYHAGVFTPVPYANPRQTSTHDRLMSAPTWAGIEEPPGRAEALAAMKAARRRWRVQTLREEAVIMVIDKPGIIAGLPYQYLNQLKTRK